MFANLYATAEQSGKLDDALARLHTYFQEEGVADVALLQPGS